MTMYAEVHSQRSTLVMEQARTGPDHAPGVSIIFMRLAVRP
jgi:hypothetical protein